MEGPKHDLRDNHHLHHPSDLNQIQVLKTRVASEMFRDPETKFQMKSAVVFKTSRAATATNGSGSFPSKMMIWYDDRFNSIIFYRITDL